MYFKNCFFPEITVFVVVKINSLQCQCQYINRGLTDHCGADGATRCLVRGIYGLTQKKLQQRFSN